MNHGHPIVVRVIGAGLAGCEVAYQLAQRGIPVELLEMKPLRRTPAQITDSFAELVCSNSFRSADLKNAIGLLKWEMRTAGSLVMDVADKVAVPAGSALAVDRDRFSELITQRIHSHPMITVKSEVVEAIPSKADGYYTVICTGPLTDASLASAIAELTGRESLYFYDAIAPIIDNDSINWDIIWRQSRYDKGEGADYANIPMNQDEYYSFIQSILDGEKVTPRAFEKAKYFEGCLPIEVMASRGVETLAHGPLKPVGLIDPRTGEQPYAVAQLRMENLEASAWNMVGFQTRLKYPEQKRIFKSLPGLENAEFLRFGSIHRNTYIHSPTILDHHLQCIHRDDLFFAGQITGVEGYVESTACGQLIAWQLLAKLTGSNDAFIPPPTTAFGAIYRHLRHDGMYGDYGPSNINWSFFSPIKKIRRERRADKRNRLSQRAQEDFLQWWNSQSIK